MQWLETIISYLHPTILVDNHLRQEWDGRHRSQFVVPIRFFFLILGLAYIANYYLFDVPMELQPLERWFWLRLSVASVCFLVAAYYWSPLTNIRWYKVPAILCCFVVCYVQALVCVWYSSEAWMFFFVFIVMSSIVLAMSPIATAFYGMVTVAAGIRFLLESGVPLPSITSGSLVAVIASAVIRSGSISDVKAFLLSKEIEEQQKTILNLNAEYLERFQSFIPKVLANRLSTLVEDQQLSVVQATVEAFKARRVNVACLFTDIRGFTQGSKDIDHFINDSVLPEVSACSETIEEHDGIPRKIGDLIFAYFDAESIHVNLVRCLAAGFNIAKINASMNATSSAVKIERYILISAGEAMVGNFGNMNSSLEITALGSPVNLLSRVDDLTKEPAMKDLLNHGDLIIDQRSFEELQRIRSPIECDLIDLNKIDLSIRDFPEERHLYRVAPTDTNRDIVVEMTLAIETSMQKLRRNGTRG